MEEHWYFHCYTNLILVLILKTLLFITYANEKHAGSCSAPLLRWLNKAFRCFVFKTRSLASPDQKVDLLSSTQGLFFLLCPSPLYVLAVRTWCNRPWTLQRTQTPRWNVQEKQLYNGIASLRGQRSRLSSQSPCSVEVEWSGMWRN